MAVSYGAVLGTASAQRSALWQWAISVLALLMPSLLNGAPLVHRDTRAYFIGGHTAVQKALMLSHLVSGDTGGDALAETIRKARGVRSVFYSLFVYLPAASVSLWLVVILQAVIMTGLLRLTFRLWIPDRNGTAVVFVILLSMLTTVSCATSVVMPDIFTGMMALSIITMLVFWPVLSTVAAGGLFVVITVALVMHITNIPIGIGLIVAGMILCRPRGVRRPAYAACAAAVLLAVVGQLAVSIVGFRQVSLAPQAPPFLLARSLHDGPGRLYLQARCPTAGYEMCKHLDKLDVKPEVFLWDKTDGVYSSVPPDEQAALRAEATPIVIAAALAYPEMQARAMLWNAFTQLITFGYYEYCIPSRATYDAHNMTLQIPAEAPWQRPLSYFGAVLVCLSTVLIIARWRTLPRPERQFFLLVASTAMFEALVGALSEPAARYEARVIWLVPMTAMLIVLRELLLRRNLTFAAAQWRS